MSNAYYTDGMYGMPVQDIGCLESIECAIAFDVRCWTEERRSAWVECIVFGVNEESEEFAHTKRMYHWTDEDVERAKKYHEQWEKLKKVLKATDDPPVWIPIKYEALTEEEKEEYKERYGMEAPDERYACVLPEDGQEVFVTTKGGFVGTDIFRSDGEGYYFESYEDVMAWMPFPEPYKEDKE